MSRLMPRLTSAPSTNGHCKWPPARQSRGMGDASTELGRLDRVVVVLVRTDGSENAGSVARLAGNFGCALRFVDVRADLDCRDAIKMAHPMESLLASAPRLATLMEAVADCAVVIGTTGKIARPGGVPTLDIDVARRLWRGPNDKVALVFGNERTGLAVEDAERCHQLVRLPTPGPAKSMNLASAAAMTLTLFQASLTTTAGVTSPPTNLSAADRAALVQTFEERLSAQGFYRAGDPGPFRPRLEELVHKMDLSPRDAVLLGELLRALSSSSVS